MCFEATQKSALKDKAIASRIKPFAYRNPEESYNLEKDPDALENLIHDPQFSKEIEIFRAKFEAYMVKTGNPELEAFPHRENLDEIARFMQE